MLRILSNRGVPLLVLLKERPRRLLLLALVNRGRRPMLLLERNPVNGRASLGASRKISNKAPLGALQPTSNRVQQTVQRANKNEALFLLRLGLGLYITAPALLLCSRTLGFREDLLAAIG
jgi:hypothetical protein